MDATGNLNTLYILDREFNCSSRLGYNHAHELRPITSRRGQGQVLEGEERKERENIAVARVILLNFLDVPLCYCLRSMYRTVWCDCSALCIPHSTADAVWYAILCNGTQVYRCKEGEGTSTIKSTTEQFGTSVDRSCPKEKSYTKGITKGKSYAWKSKSRR